MMEDVIVFQNNDGEYHLLEPIKNEVGPNAYYHELGSNKRVLLYKQTKYFDNIMSLLDYISKEK